MKSTLRQNYVENGTLKQMKAFVAKTSTTFMDRDNRNLFKKCGYIESGLFDPSVAFFQNIHNFGF